MSYLFSLSIWILFSDDQKNNSKERYSQKNNSKENSSQETVWGEATKAFNTTPAIRRDENQEKDEDQRDPDLEDKEQDEDNKNDEEQQSSEIITLLKPIYVEKQTAPKQPERESFWTFFVNRRELNNSNNFNNFNNSKRVDYSNRDLSWSQFIIQRQSFFYFNPKRLYQI